MNIAWISNQAFDNPSGFWGSSRGVYKPGGWETRAPIGSNDWGTEPDVDALTMEIHNDLSTHCWGDQGYTITTWTPGMGSGMPGISDTIARRGVSLAVYTHGSVILQTYADIRDDAVGAMSRGVPSVIGINTAAGPHYVLAKKYAQQDAIECFGDGHTQTFPGYKVFYVDYGWGGSQQDNAWVTADLFFMGTLTPYVPPTDPCAGLEDPYYSCCLYAGTPNADVLGCPH